MTRARDVANVLSTASDLATDTETAAAISTHATAANGHTGRGTTANRPASPTVGDLYFDTTLNALISYTSTGWVRVSTDAAPQIASISPTTAATTGTVVTINGANFKSGLAVQFIGTNGTTYNSPVVTFSASNICTATTPNLAVAYEPYDVKVINPDNQFAILENCLDAGGSPTWNTASGNIASVTESGSLSTSVSATDPDGTSIIYSSSNLPAWTSLNSSSGAITGTAPTVTTDTTYSFDVSASDGVNSSSRSFTLTVTNSPILISGLHSWYDASDASSIVSSSGNVTQWNDKSGNARHAVISGGGSSPKTGVASLNGKNVITFNGSTEFLVAPASITSNAFTFFAVYRRNSGGATYGRVLSLFANGGSDYADTNGFEFHAANASFLGVSAPLIGAYRNASAVTATSINYGTTYLLSATLNGGTVSHNNSGATSSGSTSTTSINAQNLNLGAGGPGGGGDQFLNGYFAEHILYTRVLTTQEISDIRSYLSTKWGVS